MGINFVQKSDWYKMDAALDRMKDLPITLEDILKTYADLGLQALIEQTPRRTGRTADSWYYVINITKPGITEIDYCNSNVNDGHNIALLIQYGHGTREGGYVEGRDYINPIMQKMFQSLADEMYKEIKSKWRV